LPNRCSSARDARRARGAAKSGAKAVTLGVEVRVTAVAVSVHCVGIVDGSWAYSDQSGVGTAEPTQMSWVCALDSPGALSAAAYRAVGVRLRKSPTPPRRKVVCGPSDPSPQAQVKPRRGDTCTSLGIRSVRTPNRESTARLSSGAPLNPAASSRAPYVSRQPPPPPTRQGSPAHTALFHAVPRWTCRTTVRGNISGLSAASAASDG